SPAEKYSGAWQHFARRDRTDCRRRWPVTLDMLRPEFPTLAGSRSADQVGLWRWQKERTKLLGGMGFGFAGKQFENPARSCQGPWCGSLAMLICATLPRSAVARQGWPSA